MIIAKQARKDHFALKDCWSSETRLSQKVLIAILGRLEQQNKLLAKLVQRKRAKPPLTKYQRFFSQHIKEGKTAKQAGKLWREKNKK